MLRFPLCSFAIPFACSLTLGCSGDLFGGLLDSASDGQSPRAETPGSGSSNPPASGGRPPGQTVASLCSALPANTLGSTPIRQLTRDEYKNSVFDLTGLEVDVTSYPRVVDDGFDNDVNLLSMDPELAAYLQQQGEALAEHIISGEELRSRIIGCEQIDDECVAAFIDSFGRRVLRRPLGADTQELYFDLYLWGKEKGGSLRGAKLVLQALLQDPYFVHRVERGTEGPVDDFELATRLSYFLWQSTPDAQLLEAAAQGELTRPDTLEQHARRLLDDPKARRMVENFHAQWLDYVAIEGALKDPYSFPEFSAELRADLHKETATFIDYVVWSGEASFSDLLGADYSFMNERVARHYGISGVEGETFQKVGLSAAQRRGILTQASILASQATADATHPILRGVYVRERILCQHLPAPPPDAPTTVPNVDYEQTRREQFDQITSAPECMGCHTLINPVGYLFENYDSVGQYQTTERDLPIDASGDVLAAGSIDGSYGDAIEFIEATAASQEAAACAVEHWYAYSQGRNVETNDACALSELQDAFSASGGDIRELIVRVVLSPAFSTRMPKEAL